MKKLLVLLVVIILAGCASNAPTVEIPTNTHEPTNTPEPGGGRDLSTPSSRLVGHWRVIREIEKGYHIEYYFSEIDSETGLGKQTEYDPRDGTVFICDYEISSESPDGEALRIFVSCPGYEEFDDFTEFVIQKDGLKAQMRKFFIEYVDDKTEYELSK
jgi:hypothetical protein